jgi:hypothetical protein
MTSWIQKYRVSLAGAALGSGATSSGVIFDMAARIDIAYVQYHHRVATALIYSALLVGQLNLDEIISLDIRIVTSIGVDESPQVGCQKHN